MKNKIILYLALIMLLFSGCTSSQPKMNISEIENGDFSSIAGTYTNPEGKSIQLDEDGLQWHERQTGEIHCGENGICSMGIHGIGIPDAGYALSIYPVGVEIHSLKTDTSKIRICYGQAEPMSELEIYTYTSNQVDSVNIESEYQAFIMKEYYDVLNETSLNYGLFNPSFEQETITFTGPYLKSSFNLSSCSYTLTLEKSFSYTKDNEQKQADLTIIHTIYDVYETLPSGKLTISDGQQFDIVYRDSTKEFLSQETYQPVNFVKNLQDVLVPVFEDAQAITQIHHKVLSVWAGEISTIKNTNKTLRDIRNARSIELTTSVSLPAKLGDIFYSAFENMNYLDVLNQSSQNYSFTRYNLYDSYLDMYGDNIHVDYYFYDHLYNLYLLDSYSYTKDNTQKNAEIVLAAACYQDKETMYDGRVTISDGQTFFISFDENTNTLLNADDLSDAYGQPIAFMKELNDWLTDKFSKMKTITQLQYPVLYQWEMEVMQVKANTNPAEKIQDARYNQSILDTQFTKSIHDFVLSDPCATAMELTRFLMEPLMMCVPDQMSDFDSTQTDESIFWDVLTISRFEPNEHFPYAHLIHKSSEEISIFILDDIQQYAYELFGTDYEPYTPDDWNTIYNSELQRYEFEIVYGFENPAVNRIENLRAEQYEDKIIVDFDVVWFDADADGNNDAETTVWSASSEYILMNENGHLFLRHVYTSFSK